jgi:ferredoxin
VTIEISIDRDQCMGSGNCTFNAPGVFALDEQGVAAVVDPSAQPEDVIIQAAKACPTQAIEITRDGERVV